MVKYCDMSKGSLNVEWLCMDSAILLPPTGTPMTGIDFAKRLPCGEVSQNNTINKNNRFCLK
ncbi:hypothetical protein NQ314_012267 [Rhamnusium bicolor]|uniref:CLEC16A/TT9 C-terminal domain-containing protein n=1 Tax=Rhamnusium bicolor TaxID=1586634 RepID=A0AAV8XCB4_9CUCU|nr:hypothetical protein NQ314_012267 [Rhamnusium bicolor]